MKIETFECEWCKEAELERDEYTFPTNEIGGCDEDSKKPICENCADEAWLEKMSQGVK